MASKEDIGFAVKSRLEQHTASPDDVVWANIESQLRKKKRRRFIYIWLVGGLLGLFAGTMWYTNSFNTSNPENTISNPSNSTTIISESDQIGENDTTKIVNSDDVKSFTSTNINTSLVNKTQPISTKNLSNKTQKSSDDKIQDEPNRNTSESNDSTDNEQTHLPQQTELGEIEEEENNTDEEIIPEKELEDELNKSEKIKDSLPSESQSRWSFTPHIIGSNYGALNATTSDNFSINYGLYVSYRMTEKAYVRTGIRKLDLEQRIDSLTNSSKYLEIPLEIKYVPFDKKLNPYVTGGLSYFILQDSNASNMMEYRATLGLNVGLGVETKLFNKLYLNLESNFNYQLQPFRENNAIHPYIFSIQTGIEYRF
ncbi:outer membrane beta-barrel protein [Winogradskyella tangerina]|uniref:outer membrane beta-barrel protein n=1 Tax=Winogradskyella tangerina TaxID=2023240 RepID=UPI000DBEA4A7|nr:outer membrane beta-barrel protein [Winogradskyella tangerina]